MSQRKIYRLNSLFELITTVRLADGSTRPVHFRGGLRSANKTGFFVTECEELQKAIEADSSFNKAFYLEAAVTAAPMLPAEEPPKKKPVEEYLRDKENVIHDDTVTSKRMAVAYVQGMFGDSFSTPDASVEEMKIEAAQKWNVLFDKWG